MSVRVPRKEVCPAGHSMVDYAGTFGCNVCGKIFKSTGKNCRRCNFDVCQQCSKKISVCVKAHPLYAQPADFERGCDRCFTQISQGTVHRCNMCDYDVCDVCLPGFDKYVKQRVIVGQATLTAAILTFLAIPFGYMYKPGGSGVVGAMRTMQATLLVAGPLAIARDSAILELEVPRVAACAAWGAGSLFVLSEIKRPAQRGWLANSSIIPLTRTALTHSTTTFGKAMLLGGTVGVCFDALQSMLFDE